LSILNWLCMGVGALMWGALSDRCGARAVVLLGGVLLGVGLMTASQTATLGQFQVLFGVLVGLAAGSFYTPLTAVTSSHQEPVGGLHHEPLEPAT
jgi:MFS family permease